MKVARAEVRCPWADNRANLERMAGWAKRGERLVFAKIAGAAGGV